MSDQYLKKLYLDITESYYQRFDDFLLKKWGEGSRRECDREKAYKLFYEKVKDDHIANRQTIRRWFGLGGTHSVPSRKYIFKIALAADLCVEETSEYLQYGISQPDFQDNDYQEFIIRYCLDHRLGLEKCRNMIHFYETKSQYTGAWEQIPCTDWLREQYALIQEYPPEEFLVWMHKHQKYFKGYSLTLLNCYQRMVEECQLLLRKDVREVLAGMLRQVGFYDWLSETKHISLYDETDIQRFLKNRLRSRTAPMNRQEAQEIRSLTAVVYSDHDRICDLIAELYSTMPGWEKNNGKYPIYNALDKDVKKVDRKYVSELMNIASLKEKQMILQMEIAREKDERAKRNKEKALNKFKQRIHLIQRSDILVLAQYIIYKKTMDELNVPDKLYNAETAKQEFCEYTNGILEMCGMRKIDETYMLDRVLLACFGDEDMYLFIEVVEEMEE